jgi:hypothetical protein
MGFKYIHQKKKKKNKIIIKKYIHIQRLNSCATICEFALALNMKNFKVNRGQNSLLIAQWSPPLILA